MGAVGSESGTIELKASGVGVRFAMSTVTTVSPVQVALVAVGVALLVWTSVDLWRSRSYSTSNKLGWQLVIVGLVVGPVVGLGDGWFVGFPLGALVYVLLAKHGPVRRQRSPHRDLNT